MLREEELVRQKVDFVFRMVCVCVIGRPGSHLVSTGVLGDPIISRQLDVCLFTPGFRECLPMPLEGPLVFGSGGSEALPVPGMLEINLLINRSEQSDLDESCKPSYLYSELSSCVHPRRRPTPGLKQVRRERERK